MKQEMRNGRSLSGKPKEMNESRKEPPNCSFQRTRIPATQLKRRPRRAAELGVRLAGKYLTNSNELDAKVFRTTRP